MDRRSEELQTLSSSVSALVRAYFCDARLQRVLATFAAEIASFWSQFDETRQKVFHAVRMSRRQLVVRRSPRCAFERLLLSPSLAVVGRTASHLKHDGT